MSGGHRMVNQKHLDILRQGVKAWNLWREEHADIQPDLRGAKLICTNLNGADLHDADLSGAKLIKADLCFANLRGAKLIKADLCSANLNGASLSSADFRRASLSYADLSRADLSYAKLSDADLSDADLRGAKLSRADLSRVNLSGAKLIKADLSDAKLRRAVLVETDLTEASLTRCNIYGIAAWNVELKGATQNDLVITPPEEPTITVDNLEVAQFIYLLLNNPKIRDVIDTIARKAVLILGRFTPPRKAVLDALREVLRTQGYLPILFDFEKPSNRNFTETVRTLAHLSRFIIADLTDPSSIPQELQAIIPTLAVPVQPVLQPCL